jgi:hypothetical protein
MKRVPLANSYVTGTLQTVDIQLTNGPGALSTLNSAPVAIFISRKDSVMRRISSLILLTTFFSFSLAWAGSPKSQSPNGDQTVTGEVMDSLCAKNGNHQEMMEQMKSMGHDGKTCSMKCMQLGAKYVLYDSSSKTIYALDDQQKAETFAGQTVHVSGTIQKNKIKVENIQPAN